MNESAACLEGLCANNILPLQVPLVIEEGVSRASTNFCSEDSEIFE